MKKFEYTEIFRRELTSVVEDCNNAGKNGWELIQIIEGPAFFSAILKRELSNESKD